MLTLGASAAVVVLVEAWVAVVAGLLSKPLNKLLLLLHLRTEPMSLLLSEETTPLPPLLTPIHSTAMEE